MIFIKQSQNEQEDEGFTFYFFLIFLGQATWIELS